MYYIISSPVLAAAAMFAVVGVAFIDVIPKPQTAARLPSYADAPDPELLATYLGCSEEAERRILSRSETAYCLDTYIRLKLSFLPDVAYERFMQLELEERWEINQRGYLAYVAWKAGARHQQ